MRVYVCVCVRANVSAPVREYGSVCVCMCFYSCRHGDPGLCFETGSVQRSQLQDMRLAEVLRLADPFCSLETSILSILGSESSEPEPRLPGGQSRV